MGTLTVEGVPEALLERLATAAAASGRCLNSELIVLLARTLPAAADARRPRPTSARPACRDPAGCARIGSDLPGRRARGVGWGGPADCRGTEGAMRIRC